MMILPSPALAWTFVTFPGGLLSLGGGSGGGVVPGAGFGRMVSLALADILLPLASVAVNLTVVVPTGKNRGASCVIVGCGSAISLTLDPKINREILSSDAKVPESSTAYALMSPGGFRVGGVVSRTVTLNEACPVFACESVAEQFTVVGPSGKVDPEAGTHGTLGIGPLTRSTAVGDR